MEDEIFPRMQNHSFLRPRSPTSIHPWGSCTWNVDKLMNSWPHSCSHSTMACSQPHPPAQGSHHSQSPWRQQGALSTLYLCPPSLPSGATQALQPEDPNSLGSPAQAQPLRRHKCWTSGPRGAPGPQQIFNNPAFTWKWKQVNLWNFSRTLLEHSKSSQSSINSCWAHTGILIHVSVAGLFTKVLLKKKVAFCFFLKKWLKKMRLK